MKTREEEFRSKLMDLGVRKEGHTCFHVGEDRKVHDEFRLHKDIASELRMGRL